MNLKSFFMVLPLAVGLVSCGGAETTEVAEEAAGEQTQSWGSTYETCAGNNSFSYTEATKEDFVLEPYFNDGASYEHHGGELTKNKKSIYIRFSNSAESVTKSLGALKEGEITFSLNINTRGDEELKAGAYKKGDINVSLTRATRDAEGLKTAQLGSNKTSETVTINSISRGHACGTYIMTNESGDELIKMEFDTDITLSAW